MHLTRPHKAIRKCSWRTGLMFCWRRSKPQFLPRIFTTEAQRHRGKSAVQYSHSFCEADKELISSLCLCDSVVNKKAEARRPRLQLAGCPDKIWHRYRRTQTWRMYDAPQAPASREFSLRRPARAYRQVSHLRQNARHLHPVQLRKERQHLRHERILHQFPNLLLAVAFAASQKIGDGDLERARQPLE